MDQHFEHGERLRLGGVDDAMARRVPAATEAAGAFTGEGKFSEAALDDAPDDDAHAVLLEERRSQSDLRRVARLTKLLTTRSRNAARKMTFEEPAMIAE